MHMSASAWHSPPGFSSSMLARMQSRQGLGGTAGPVVEEVPVSLLELLLLLELLPLELSPVLVSVGTKMSHTPCSMHLLVTHSVSRNRCSTSLVVSPGSHSRKQVRSGSGSIEA